MASYDNMGSVYFISSHSLIKKLSQLQASDPYLAKLLAEQVITQFNMFYSSRSQYSCYV